MRRSALLVAVVLLGAGCQEAPKDAPVQRTTTVADLVQAKVHLRSACPPPTTDLPYPPGAQLPHGAVVVRACPSPKEYPWAMPTVPVDALTTEPDRMVDVINALEPVPDKTACTMQGGTAMDLWFGYPGGRASVVHVDTGGCGWTFTSTRGEWNEGAVDGPTEPLAAFQSALLDQRSHQRPPTRRWPRARCNPSAQPLGLVGLRPGTRLDSGTYCVLEDGLRWRSAAIPSSLLKQVTQGLDDSGSRGQCHHPFAVLKLVTVWGDRQDLAWDRCTLQWNAPSGPALWQPSPDFTRTMDQLPLGPPYWQRRPNGTIVR